MVSLKAYGMVSKVYLGPLRAGHMRVVLSPAQGWMDDRRKVLRLKTPSFMLSLFIESNIEDVRRD